MPKRRENSVCASSQIFSESITTPSASKMIVVILDLSGTHCGG
jgi:hypothetical protein